MTDHATAAALENALLREIREQYKLLALTYFKGGLAIPQLELVPTRHRLGRWVPGTRTIELSRHLVMTEPWGVVVEVLKHEMAHQYVYEVLGEREETPHGPRFRAVCERLGIDGAAAGMPSDAASSASKAEHAKVAERIARLLALAESPNVNEAEAAMAAAQRLLLKHNLELRSLRAAQGYVWKHLGAPTGRTTEAERVLSLLLGKHFFVEAIWVSVYRQDVGKRGSILEICGSEDNVEIAEYVHGYLIATAERLWREHKVAHGVRGDRDRRTFLAGVMSGMSDKLAREAKKSADAGLVWIADGDLQRWFRQRHPHVRHVRYAGQRRSDAYTHGKDAGSKIVIHRGVKEGPTERGLALPPRR
ncbi:MAG: SprT-like domain-containing protein [Labilithrix sp.]|nr:SprT-like domain-containing protein [Labilithrix sp.]MCW5816706.1 SprT-like domain-containing protein [Labilithrix sp.]